MNHRVCLAALWAVVSAAGPAWAAAIRAAQEGADTIRVVVPGKFETTFTKRKGFVSTWYDLKHDPEKKLDIAPVADENGILWTKARGGELKGDGSWYANPAQKMELLEAGPTRVRVRLSGPHRKYGKTDPKFVWTALGFEQTFTLYPTGDVYIDYVLVTQEPVPLHHFLLIIKSTGAWGKRGKGEVHCAGLHGEKRPAPWSKSLSPFALQWSHGPTYFQDILMVMYKGTYNGSYWNEGFRDRDLRAGLNLLGRWPDKTVPKGRDHIRVLMRFDDGINSPAAAALYANDYRSPDRLAVAKGRLDTADEGDRDAEGFNEAEGCYVLQAGAEGVAFTLHGSKIPRMDPAFKVKGWAGRAPGRILAGGKSLTNGKEFVASVRAGGLLVQVLEDIKRDVAIVIRAGRTGSSSGTGAAGDHAADWPQWRGPRRDGISHETGWAAKWPDGGPKVLWKASVGEGFSGPAVVGKRLYTMGFIKEKGAKPPGTGRGSGLDHVWCLDTDTGEPLWKHTYPSKKGSYYGPFVTPTVDAGRVYTLSKFGHLFCLDAASGKVVWAKHTVDDLGGKQPYYGYSCHLLVVGERLILDIGGKDGPLVGLNKSSGDLVWRAGKGSGAYSCPVAYDAGGTTAVAILLPTAAIGVRADDGRVLWQHPWRTGSQSSATMPLVSGTRVFVSASERKQWCALLDVGGGQAKVVWENKNMLNYFNASVLWKDHLYGIHSLDHVSRNWRLRCVDFNSGEVKWEKDEPGLAAVTLAGGRLLVLSEKGELIVAEASPERYTELSRAKVLDGKCWLPPVLCRGRIYCRDHRGTLVCLDVSGK